MLDEHWTRPLAEHVLTGFLSTAFGGLVDAGVAVAWLHNAAAFTKRTLLGNGRLTTTTFELRSDAAAKESAERALARGARLELTNRRLARTAALAL